MIVLTLVRCINTHLKNRTQQLPFKAWNNRGRGTSFLSLQKTTSQSNNNGKQLKVLFGLRSSVRSSRLDPYSPPERLRGGNHASNHGRGSSQGQSKPLFEQTQFPRRGSPDSHPLAGDWAKERQHLFLDPRGVAAAGEEKARQACEWPHQSYW